MRTAHAIFVVICCGVVAARDDRAPTVLKPHESVRKGNELLNQGDAKGALDRYEEASRALPDAREVAFDAGLAKHALGNQAEARAAFEKALLDPPDALADDALYSLGACDHSEALSPNGEPKQKLSKLESAMEKYQQVLARRPDHAAARESNQKAAAYWRQIKQQMEQQEQQQKNQDKDQNQDQQDQDQQSQQDKQSDSQKKDSQQSKDQQAQQKQQQQEQQESQSEESQASKEKEQQQNADQKTEEEQQPQEATKDKEDDQKPDEQKQTAEQTAMVTREQAERQLREMVQALQDRNKLRREEAQKPPAPAASKDW